MRKALAATPLALLMALGSAAPEPAPAAPPEIDLEAESAALMAADRAWFEAYSASDSPADVFAEQVVEDAALLPPEAPLTQGREAIREVIANLEAIPGFSVTWSPSFARVAEAGDLGYTIGAYEMTMAPEGQAVRLVGKYLTVWSRQADGTWMVTADMFNADGSPSPVEE